MLPWTRLNQPVMCDRVFEINLRSKTVRSKSVRIHTLHELLLDEIVRELRIIAALAA